MSSPPPGALLLHGFTATPDCLESLAVPLRKAGFQVEAPLLPGHGTTPDDLLRTRWQDWYGAAAAAFDRLNAACRSVSVAGLSLGGLLALLVAAERPVTRLALLATPVFFTGPLIRFVLPLLARTPLGRLYRYQRKWMGAAIRDPEGRRRFRSYEEMPIPSIWEIVRLQKVVRRRLRAIAVPTLILHSPHDITAPYANMEFLKKSLGAGVVRTVTCENSNHVLTMDYDKERVADEIVRFFGEES